MKQRPLTIFLYGLSIACFLAGLFLLIRQYVLLPGKYEPPVSPTPALSPSPTVTITPSVSATPAPTPSPTPYVKPIPTRIYFTEAEVMADIVPVGIIEEGEGPVSYTHLDVYKRQLHCTHKRADFQEIGQNLLC